jgi:hypothetical protein
MGSGSGIGASFQRVREILREAADGNQDAFGGLPLWELSRDKLLSARIHDILLIAPTIHAFGKSSDWRWDLVGA